MKNRKLNQLKICLQEEVEAGSAGFGNYSFPHNALPEINFTKVDTSTTFLGKKLSAPILISAMTGGSEKGFEINKNLALAAQKMKVAMGVGSQRVAIENPKLADTFQVRKFAPDVLLFANLGAVQLNYGYGVSECQKVVSMISADALVLHLNPLQEVIQTGDTNFENLLPKIEKICQKLSVPVIVKEVGFGISEDVARRLFNAGIKIIDVAGYGGTNWALVAGKVAGPPLGETFKNWGIPAAYSIQMCKKIEGLKIVGSGGIRSGIDIAKAIVLGADLVGLARPFLKEAARSASAVEEKIANLALELKVAMFCVGAQDLSQLQKVKLVNFPVYSLYQERGS
ncbi:MAG: type 2 isopentenyl-diphosphate Delta-isomerase [Candidatus Cloacimonetes bacterium]|nr:type 2 isopentenyl-diphosphate Delta-isomerase [Candidatus Cloacimonadota bacterium]